MIKGRESVMDYYKLLLSRVNTLPSGIPFTIGQAFKEGWTAIPSKEKIEMCRRFKMEVNAGQISGVVFTGTVPGSTHPHKQYIKI